MTYKPDLDRYQQLDEPRTGRFDCSAYTGAFLADYEKGKPMTTGREVRLKSSEPVPDPRSPGLNYPQTDAAVRKATDGKVDLGCHIGLDTDEVKRRVLDGRAAGIQVNRAVIVAEGVGGGSDFRGGHSCAIFFDSGRDLLLMFDPLLRQYMPVSFNQVFRAAGALVVDMNGHVVGQGRANVLFTADVTADYVVDIHPEPGHRKAFRTFKIARTGKNKGEIIDRGRDVTRGFTAACSKERFYPWDGHGGRTLVRILEGAREGKYVNAKWSRPE